MTEYSGPLTQTGLRDALDIVWNSATRNKDILLNKQVIGRCVSYGKKDMLRVRSVPKTEFASRIHWQGMRIEVTANSQSSLINKVATELSRGLKAQASNAVEGSGPDEEPQTLRP